MLRKRYPRFLSSTELAMVQARPWVPPPSGIALLRSIFYTHRRPHCPFAQRLHSIHRFRGENLLL